ncbi:MAG: hypothetical protein HYV77_02295 [Candidatus Wildermuthbacteria bacterium]|nr:hypothetical protein [Candidatus Wildermuthbacteria bacterium]
MEINATKQKIILLLSSGIALGFAYSPHQQYRILQITHKAWKKIDEQKLKRDIRELYRSQLIKVKENSDKSLTYVLTSKGKLKALTYNFNSMRISRSKWDKKWRIVIFDIPETLRKGRDALRKKLLFLGFYELQKSVLVFPFPCQNEIEFIIEFFGLRKFVRFGTLDAIDNDIHLRQFFGLS